MNPNPALGVFFHWLGGLASGSFYVPYRGVKNWAWETYWLVGGFFSWVIAPWILALSMTHELSSVLHEAPVSSLFWTYAFGVLWGLGGLTFGLTMRYLGMSLGMAVALGYTAAFGTLMPPIFPRRIRYSSARKPVGTHYPHRCCDLHGWDCFRWRSRHFQRTGNVGRAEASVDQGIQSEEGASRCDILGNHERMFCLRTGRW